MDSTVEAIKSPHRGRQHIEATLTVEEIRGLPAVLDAVKVGQILGLSSRQVVNLAAENKLPGRYCGFSWRFSTQEVCDYIGITL